MFGHESLPYFWCWSFLHFHSLPSIRNDFFFTNRSFFDQPFLFSNMIPSLLDLIELMMLWNDKRKWPIGWIVKNLFINCFCCILFSTTVDARLHPNTPQQWWPSFWWSRRQFPKPSRSRTSHSRKESPEYRHSIHRIVYDINTTQFFPDCFAMSRVWWKSDNVP